MPETAVGVEIRYNNDGNPLPPRQTTFNKIKQMGHKVSSVAQAAKQGALQTRVGTSATKIVSGLGKTIVGVGELSVATAALPVRAVKIAVDGTTPTTNSKMVGILKEHATKLDKIPSFYKIMFLIFFYIFFYKIIFDIGIFIGFGPLDLILYMVWFGILLLFLSFIGPKRSKLYN